MTQVRIATPSAAMRDDPDNKEILPESIVYAKIENSNNIFVLANGQQHTVPAPIGSYRGISVDPHFLWVYGGGGQNFWCATHASIMSCFNKKRQAPLWLGDGKVRRAMNLDREVFDVSSCPDGTLLVASATSLSTSPFHVEFNGPARETNGLVIDRWEWLQGGGGVQCQKLPIFGWSRIQGLATLLSQQKSK